MSKLHPFPLRPDLVARLKAHGFCAKEADKRYPVQHDLPALLRGQSQSRHRSAADLLLADRQTGRAPQDRNRVLPWAIPLGGLLGWPRPVKAHDHHPERIAEPLDAAPTHGAFNWLTDWLTAIDFGDPVWAIAFGSTLLMTQTIGLFQRQRLVKAATQAMAETQPDLFPETLPEEQAGPNHVWEVDAATRQGQVRTENQDAFEVLRLTEDTSVMIVCDGAGGIGGGREASQSAVAAIAKSLREMWDANATLALVDLETAVANARQTAKDKRLEGATTALVILLDGDEISYATLGDGAVTVIWPDGMVGPLQVPHHTVGRPPNQINAFIGGKCDAPPRVGSLRLEPGSIVMAMSDGASDLFPFEEFASKRDKVQSLTGMADHLLAGLEAARDPDSGAWLHSDNLTLAMARLNAGGM